MMLRRSKLKLVINKVKEYSKRSGNGSLAPMGAKKMQGQLR